ncbi:MAG: hypothetical protein HQL28_01840 [Candidatus Omnitrophica bacterium]|nr:hypothetical protein [Candidatus Omnitrophota bacterium]
MGTRTIITSKAVNVIVAVIFMATNVGVEMGHTLSPELSISKASFQTPYSTEYGLDKVNKILDLLEQAKPLTFATVEDITGIKAFLKKDINDLDFVVTDGEILIKISGGSIMRFFDPSKKPENVDIAKTHKVVGGKIINKDLRYEILLPADAAEKFIPASIEQELAMPTGRSGNKGPFGRWKKLGMTLAALMTLSAVARPATIDKGTLLPEANPVVLDTAAGRSAAESQVETAPYNISLKKGWNMVAGFSGVTSTFEEIFGARTMTIFAFKSGAYEKCETSNAISGAYFVYVTDDVEAAFTVRVDPNYQTIELSPGWILVPGPSVPIQRDKLSAEGIGNYPIWHWNTETNSYENTDVLWPNMSYWVYTDKGGVLNYTPILPATNMSVFGAVHILHAPASSTIEVEDIRSGAQRTYEYDMVTMDITCNSNGQVNGFELGDAGYDGAKNDLVGTLQNAINAAVLTNNFTGGGVGDLQDVFIVITGKAADEPVVTSTTIGGQEDTTITNTGTVNKIGNSDFSITKVVNVFSFHGTSGPSPHAGFNFIVDLNTKSISFTTPNGVSTYRPGDEDYEYMIAAIKIDLEAAKALVAGVHDNLTGNTDLFQELESALDQLLSSGEVSKIGNSDFSIKKVVNIFSFHGTSGPSPHAGFNFIVDLNTKSISFTTPNGVSTYRPGDEDYEYMIAAIKIDLEAAKALIDGTNVNVTGNTSLFQELLNEVESVTLDNRGVDTITTPATDGVIEISGESTARSDGTGTVTDSATGPEQLTAAWPENNTDKYAGLPSDRKLSIGEIAGACALALLAAARAQRDKRTLFVQKTNEFVENSKQAIGSLFGDGKPLRLRVAVDVLANKDNEIAIMWISALSRFENIYVELYRMQEPDIVLKDQKEYDKYDAMYHKNGEYAISMKSFPESDIRKENTLTLLGASKDMSKSDLQFMVKSSELFKNSVVVPLGITGDPTGAIRATLFGMRLVQIARTPGDEELIRETASKYRAILDACAEEDVTLSDTDILAMVLQGSINSFVNVLKKLIENLPMEKVSIEEQKSIFERALTIAHAA